MPAPRSALPTSVRAQKCRMVMSVTTQIFFPYMSDARTPAMDVQMAAQDACMTRSFHVFLSAMLIEDVWSSPGSRRYSQYAHGALSTQRRASHRKEKLSVRTRPVIGEDRQRSIAQECCDYYT